MSWLGRWRSADRAGEPDWPAVLALLRDFACPSCGEDRVWRGRGGLVKRLNSYTGFAACRNCGERVFVKRIRRYPRVDPIERARREYDNAVLLHRAMPDDDCTGVARPLAVIDGTLVFAYVPGIPLDRAVRWKTPEDRSAILSKAGTWFARLHLSDTGSEHGNPDFPSRLVHLRDQCAAAAGRYPSVSRALELQRRRLESLADRSFPLVLVHGDAKAENFLLSGSRVIAVDVDYRMRGLAEMDLAQFLVQMRVTRSRSLALAANGDHARDESAFLAGYARLRSVDAGVLAWMETYFTLSLWMNGRRRGRLRRFQADAVFRAELNRLLDFSSGAGTIKV